jgi:hypothetical protein
MKFAFISIFVLAALLCATPSYGTDATDFTAVAPIAPVANDEISTNDSSDAADTSFDTELDRRTVSVVKSGTGGRVTRRKLGGSLRASENWPERVWGLVRV